ELSIALYEAATGMPDAAVARLERLCRRAVDEGDELGVAWVTGRLVEVELTRGRWPRARELAAALAASARLVDTAASLRAPALLAEALVAAHDGDLPAGRRAAEE